MDEDRGPFFTIEESCVKARGGYSTIRRALKSGELASVRVGRRVLISATSLQRYLARDLNRPSETPTTPQATR